MRIRAPWHSRWRMRIVHEDDHLAVVDKPSGMLVHPTQRVKVGTLRDELQARWGTPPGLVHRLDRDTSGLLVVARTPQAHAVLARHFEERRVHKAYLAIVDGRVGAPVEVDAPIGGDGRWCVTPDGRPARTSVIPLVSGERSLLRLIPHTGRTHQLRLHCAHLGHPIVGDVRYGGATAERLCLHAAELGFFHPYGGGWLDFRSEAPPEFGALAYQASSSCFENKPS